MSPQPDILTAHAAATPDKLALIERVVAPVASEMFTSFLRVLARHDRLGIFASFEEIGPGVESESAFLLLGVVALEALFGCPQRTEHANSLMAFID